MRSAGTASAARALAGPKTSARAPAANVAPVSLKKPRLERFTLTSFTGIVRLAVNVPVCTGRLGRVGDHPPFHTLYGRWKATSARIPPGRERRSVSDGRMGCPRRLRTRGVGGREEKCERRHGEVRLPCSRFRDANFEPASCRGECRFSHVNPLTTQRG